MGQLRPGGAPGSNSYSSGQCPGYLGPPPTLLPQPSLLGQGEPQPAPRLRPLAIQLVPTPGPCRPFSGCACACALLCFCLFLHVSLSLQRQHSRKICLYFHTCSLVHPFIRGPGSPPLRQPPSTKSSSQFSGLTLAPHPSPCLWVFRVPSAPAPRLLGLGGLANQSQGLPLDPTPALRPQPL